MCDMSLGYTGMGRRFRNVQDTEGVETRFIRSLERLSGFLDFLGFLAKRVPIDYGVNVGNAEEANRERKGQWRGGSHPPVRRPCASGARQKSSHGPNTFIYMYMLICNIRTNISKRTKTVRQGS